MCCMSLQTALATDDVRAAPETDIIKMLLHAFRQTNKVNALLALLS